MTGPLYVTVDWPRTDTTTAIMSDTFTGANGSAWSSTNWQTGLTPAGGSVQIQSNAGRLTTGTAGGYAGASRVSRRVNQAARADVVMRMRFKWPTGMESYPQLAVRSTSTNLDTQDGYRVEFNNLLGQWSVARVSGYTQTILGSAVTRAFASNTWYWAEFGAIGTSVKAKVWIDGQIEPGYAAVGAPTAFSVAFVDSTITAAGYYGVTVGPGNLGNDTFDIDDFAATTYFSDAPRNDVSDRVRGPISVSYGRDQDTALTPTMAGHGSLELDNSSRDYSPRNAASPLYGLMKPARPVLIQRVVSGTTYTIARMHTDDSPINPDTSTKTVSLGLIDNIADFRDVKATTTLYQGVRTGEAIGYLLTAAGWTGGRDLDAGATIIPWWWVDTTDVYQALCDLVASEGPPALLTISATGAIVFRDRHHRLTHTASNTSQQTWRSDGVVEPVMASGFAYDSAWRNVINNAQLSVDVRKPWKKVGVVWSADETIYLDPFSFETVTMQTSDPFMDAVMPVSGTDYTGTGAHTVALSRTSGASTTITFFTGLFGATIVGLQLRARSVPVGHTVQVSASDTASIADYGARGLSAGSEPVWAGRYDAQAIADTAVLQRAQPLPVVNVRFSCAQSQTTRLAKVLDVDLSDRVTVIEAETVLNDPFFVESISHTISSVADHEVTFGLEGVPASPTARPFMLDSDALGGTAVLGV